MSSSFRFSPRAFPLALDDLGCSEPGARVPDGHGLLARALLGFGAERRPVLLDSAAGWPRGFSLLGFDPLDAAAPQRFEELERFAARLRRAGDGDQVPGPFEGGFLGALAYDLGVPGERQVLPGEPWSQPLVVGGLYADFLVHVDGAREVVLVLADDPGDGRPPVEVRRHAVVEALRAALGAEPPARPRALGPLARHVPSSEHRARIEELRARIARGEFYQANLAHRFTGRVACEPAELYLRLRETNAAPYAGFLHWRDEAGREGALCSTSPELLLELGRIEGRRIARTRPIKGTAPRFADPERDRRSADGLLASEKDRAELAMIVDLERNDLGRTARTGTVAVEQFPALRSYERVHHLTADVLAEPRESSTAWDVLGALFPGGSVTGAPKLASMEAIAELEREGRGFFCGSMGFVDTRGEARFNVLIRTVLWRATERERADAAGRRPGEVSFRVGGGITWSSDPVDEDAETLAKASALMDALAPPERALAATPVGKPAPICGREQEDRA